MRELGEEEEAILIIPDVDNKRSVLGSILHELGEKEEAILIIPDVDNKRSVLGSIP